MIARALLGGGDLAGSRAIGVSLKIAWELEPSPRRGGQGPAAATGRVRVLFTTGIGEVEREVALVIRAASPWPIFGIATCSLRGSVSANGGGGRRPRENTRRLPAGADGPGGG